MIGHVAARSDNSGDHGAIHTGGTQRHRGEIAGRPNGSGARTGRAARAASRGADGNQSSPVSPRGIVDQVRQRIAHAHIGGCAGSRVHHLNAVSEWLSRDHRVWCCGFIDRQIRRVRGVLRGKRHRPAVVIHIAVGRRRRRTGAAKGRARTGLVDNLPGCSRSDIHNRHGRSRTDGQRCTHCEGPRTREQERTRLRQRKGDEHATRQLLTGPTIVGDGIYCDAIGNLVGEDRPTRHRGGPAIAHRQPIVERRTHHGQRWVGLGLVGAQVRRRRLDRDARRHRMIVRGVRIGGCAGDIRDVLHGRTRRVRNHRNDDVADVLIEARHSTAVSARASHRLPDDVAAPAILRSKECGAIDRDTAGQGVGHRQILRRITGVGGLQREVEMRADQHGGGRRGLGQHYVAAGRYRRVQSDRVVAADWITCRICRCG